MYLEHQRGKVFTGTRTIYQNFAGAYRNRNANRYAMHRQSEGTLAWIPGTREASVPPSTLAMGTNNPILQICLVCFKLKHLKLQTVSEKTRSQTWLLWSTVWFTAICVLEAIHDPSMVLASLHSAAKPAKRYKTANMSRNRKLVA